MITLLLLLGTLFNTVSSTSTPCSGTSYSVPFPYGATNGAPDLVVAAGGVTLPYSSGWTINKVSSTSTGTITLTTACTGTLTITRTTPRTQPTPYRTQGKLDLGVLETNLDRIAMQMQESVGMGGSATLSSLSITTPLPLGSGGTGAALPACGAGFITSDGTKLLCAAPSGLAPPGTTSVALQSASPGSLQGGHAGLRGSIVLLNQVDVVPPVALWNAAALGTPSTSGGSIYLDSVALVPTNFNLGGALRLVPNSYGTNPNGAGAKNNDIFEIYGPRNTTQPMMGFGWNHYTGGTGTGYSYINFSGCGNGSFPGGVGAYPCISTMVSANGGMTTPLYLSGTYNNAADNAVIVTTNGTNRTVAGYIFAVQNNGGNIFGVDIAGIVTSAGLTSSGPVSGTTGSFSSTLGVTGTTTLTGSAFLNGGTSTTTLTASSTSAFTGQAALNGGVTIGSGGTAISKSLRGTRAVSSGTIGAGLCVDQSITITGALAGADCAIGQEQAAPAGTLSQCAITADTCIYHTCNYTAGGIVVPAQTLSCRVFNP